MQCSRSDGPFRVASDLSRRLLCLIFRARPAALQDPYPAVTVISQSLCQPPERPVIRITHFYTARTRTVVTRPGHSCCVTVNLVAYR